MAKYPVRPTAQIDLFSLAFAPAIDAPSPAPDLLPTPAARPTREVATTDSAAPDASGDAVQTPNGLLERPHGSPALPSEAQQEPANATIAPALMVAVATVDAALAEEVRTPPQAEGARPDTSLTRASPTPPDLTQTLAAAFAQRDHPTASPAVPPQGRLGEHRAPRTPASPDATTAERPAPARRAGGLTRPKPSKRTAPAPIATPAKKTIAPIWERLDGPWARQVRRPFQPENAANKKKREARYGELLDQFRALPPEARGVDATGTVVSGAMSEDAEQVALEMVALAWPGALDKIHYHLSKHDPEGHRSAVGMVAAAMLKGVQAYNPEIRGEKTGKQKALWNYLLDEADFAVLALKNESSAVRMTRAAENAGKDFLEATAEIDRKAAQRGQLRADDRELLAIMNRVRRSKLPDTYAGLDTIRAAMALEKDASRRDLRPTTRDTSARLAEPSNALAEDGSDDAAAPTSADRAQTLLGDFIAARSRLSTALQVSEADLVADPEHRRALVKEMNAIRREATIPYPTVKSVRTAEQHARNLGGAHSLNKSVGESDDAPRRQDLLAGTGGEADDGMLTEDMLAAKKRTLLREPNPHAFINAQLTQMGVPRRAIGRGLGINEKAYVDITATSTEGPRPFANQFAPTTWDGTALKLIAVRAAGTPDMAERLKARREHLTDRLPTRLSARLT